MKTLIISDSHDATVDLVVHYLGGNNIFRLNYDFWQDYEIYLSQDDFIISDSYRQVTRNEISKVYWRKPFMQNVLVDGKLDNYLNNELRYIFIEIFNILRNDGKAVLVRPYEERRLGKLLQLQIAKKYFRVPNWRLSLNLNLGKKNVREVVKSLSSVEVEKNKLIFSQEIEAERLDCKYPWFIQDFVESGHDLTVVYINGDIFAFTLNRSLFHGIDWRKYTFCEEIMDWQQFFFT